MHSKDDSVLTACAAINKQQKQGSEKTLGANVSNNARLMYSKTLSNRAYNGLNVIITKGTVAWVC